MFKHSRFVGSHLEYKQRSVRHCRLFRARSLYIFIRFLQMLIKNRLHSKSAHNWTAYVYIYIYIYSVGWFTHAQHYIYIYTHSQTRNTIYTYPGCTMGTKILDFDDPSKLVNSST